MLHQPPEKGQRRAVLLQCWVGFRCAGRGVEPVSSDDRLYGFNAQVVGNRGALDLAARACKCQRCFIKADVQRNRGRRVPCLQRVVLHHISGQHGDFVAWNVNGRQAGARYGIKRVIGLHGKPGRCDVYAQRNRACAQPADRERVINFGGVAVIH